MTLTVDFEKSDEDGEKAVKMATKVFKGKNEGEVIGQVVREMARLEKTIGKNEVVAAWPQRVSYDLKDKLEVAPRLFEHLGDQIMSQY